MLQVNVQEAKTHLSRYLDAAEEGEVIVLCRHNKPVAELRAVQQTPNSSGIPQFGLWAGFGVADSFFDPLPEDFQKAFSGE